MTTEFNLSEKMEVTILFDSRYGKNKTFVYREADVKEFIRLLKEKDIETRDDIISYLEKALKPNFNKTDILVAMNSYFEDLEIDKDKLAGEKLI